MKVYLSLPISGYDRKERWNYAARTCAALTWEHPDWHVVNPFHVSSRLHREKMERTGRVDLPTYEEMMEADLNELSDCQLAVFCPGWNASEGCKREMELCRQEKIDVMFLSKN